MNRHTFNEKSATKSTLYQESIPDRITKLTVHSRRNSYRVFCNDSYEPDRICWCINNQKELTIKRYRSYYSLKYTSCNRLLRERMKDYC